jgi:hypothetical protein
MAIRRRAPAVVLAQTGQVPGDGGGLAAAPAGVELCEHAFV